MNPDYVTQVRWWESKDDFTKRPALEAAELIALEVLDPVLRSRGAIKGEAKRLYEDKEFKQRIQKLFQSEATGCLIVPSLADLIWQMAEIEKRVSGLESRLGELTRSK
jgi:hypothetical protein